MKFKVTKMEFITRKYVRANPAKIFLFGDNFLGQGYRGQAAAMRGEPNAIGIPTKKKPSNHTDAFFNDAEFEQNEAAIDHAFARLDGYGAGTEIVIPSAGLGTGLAKLPHVAPRTFEYLERRLALLEESI
jgi:hypothetical protein